MTTRQITWTAAGGQAIEITLTAQHTLDSQGRRRTAGRLELHIDATIDGKSLGGMARLATIDHASYVATYGTPRQAVGLTQDNLDRYNTALAEMQAIIDEHNAPLDAHVAELDAMTAANEAMYRNAH